MKNGVELKVLIAENDPAPSMNTVISEASDEWMSMEKRLCYFL